MLQNLIKKQGTLVEGLGHLDSIEIDATFMNFASFLCDIVQFLYAIYRRINVNSERIIAIVRIYFAQTLQVR